MIEGYHRLSRQAQLELLSELTGVGVATLAKLPIDAVRQQQIENYLTDFKVPEGIAVNFQVNGREHVVPMVTEEPSVIAAASNGAKLVCQAGGFQAQSQRLMRGQLLINTKASIEISQWVVDHQEHLLEVANAAHPSMQKRGGGALKIMPRPLSATQISVDLLVDTREAMGANTINTMLEALKTEFEVAGIGVEMAILSNLADQALTTVTCTIPATVIDPAVAQKIADASEFAQVDPYRAATHNKGIMNGIDAVVMATGNDWRAIESGAHAFAARDGQYRGLSTWQVVDHQLQGRLVVPLPVATVGGSIGINEQAQLNLELLQVDSANQLAEVIGAVGLAQNLAALKAIVTEGIQHGHMRLQAKSLLLEHGLPATELNEAVPRLLKESRIDATHAQKVIEQMRKKDLDE
ncbi:hydroxymethylglutaryl-CoA reductase, degradative [Pediococcus acidilactici]